MRGLLLPLLLLLSVPAMAIDVQGHRGARGHAPENTLPGFERALAIGVTTLELDVGVTSDGVVVVHHDRRLNPDLARGLDGEWIQPPGPAIHALSYKDLRRFDVGRLRPGSEYARRFNRQQPYDGTPIPRLADLFALAGKTQVRFNIETKLSPDAPQETLAPVPFARALVAEVRKAGMEARTTVQSFDWRTLEVVEREAPEIATAYLTGRHNSDPALVHAAGGKIWSPPFEVLTKENVSIAKRSGIRIVPWTVNEPGDIARMIELGVDGIISDYPDRVLELLKR